MQLQKKKHIYKNRNKKYSIKNINILRGNCSLYTLKKCRYELIYLRFIKKYLKQKHIRRKMSFRKRKYWFFLRPNYILTSKSTNARMGAGVGSLIRLTIQLSSYKVFCSLNNYSYIWIKKLYRGLRFKYNFKFLYKIINLISRLWLIISLK